MQSNLQQNQIVDFLISRKTVEKMCGLSRATIYRLMKLGKFPNSVSIGTGAVRWRQSEVVAWQMSRPATVKI
jgi:prophage regulatory protein